MVEHDLTRSDRGASLSHAAPAGPPARSVMLMTRLTPCGSVMLVKRLTPCGRVTPLSVHACNVSVMYVVVTSIARSVTTVLRRPLSGS